MQPQQDSSDLNQQLMNLNHHNLQHSSSDQKHHEKQFQHQIGAASDMQEHHHEGTEGGSLRESFDNGGE